VTEDRCEKHDLIVGQCADCRGLKEDKPTDDLLIDRFYLSAKFEQACAVGRDGPDHHLIREGERFAKAVYDGDGPPWKNFGYVCDSCADIIASPRA